MTVRRPVPGANAACAWWFFTAPLPVFAAAPGSDPVRVAQDVFQGQDYWWKRVETRTVPTSWLESILAATRDFLIATIKAIVEWLIAILRSLRGVFTGDASALTNLIWLAVAVLVAWSAWKLYPVIMRWLRAAAPGSPAPGTEVISQTLAEPADLYEQAVQAFRDGSHAEAIRLALLSLIARLEKQGRLRYDTTRTNREYQIELRSSSEIAACFGQLARIYERVWYGRAPAGRAEAERALGLSGSMINGEGPAPE